MATLKAMLVHAIIAWFSLLVLTASPHVIERRIEDVTSTANDSSAILHERSDIDQGEAGLWKTFNKRGQFNFVQGSDGDKAILRDAFNDMVDLVTYVARNSNEKVLRKYFRASDKDDVTRIFDTVRQMAQDNGHPDSTPQIGPKDLNKIVINRAKGVPYLLADSSDLSLYSTHPTIRVLDFGWAALYRRRVSEIDCNCHVKKVNYKLHFLGSLILHEVL